MGTSYSIHPAIGIARLGNSPDEFFIGPERPGERPLLEGRFKDAQLRVKRQAARFRIFAHHADGTSHELTDAEAEIRWTVHVANKKAAYAGRGNTEPPADLIIDPGPRTLGGPNQRQLFDGGHIQFAGQAAVEVPLGELRTDADNHLLVLGGFGTSASPAGNGIDYFWASDGWYDDISDGPVTATIKLRATQESPPVTGAWVIVAPPKFAPHQDSVTTLYDRLQQTMIDAGLLGAPASTSYTRDVYPILQRTHDIRWVYTTGNSSWPNKHAWPQPVLDLAQRQAIFARLRPASNMPRLNGNDSALTPTQLAHMERWKNDTNFVNDWSGPPQPDANITAEGLDRAALEACVGGAFYPGIEAGGRNDAERPITTHANYAQPFRLNHAVVGPGDISASMALPWQADFFDCADNWWPVPRPNAVIAQGQEAYHNWTRDIQDYADMVAKWHTLGFVVKRGDEHVEVETTELPTITLLTPYLNFEDVPQGVLGMVREQALAIELEVSSASVPVTLAFAPGGAPAHPQLRAAASSVSVGPTSPNGVAIARLYVVYATGEVGSAIPTQTVTLQHVESGQLWSIQIDANTVVRTRTALALVLDRSGSMAEDAGDGHTKHATLQSAASVFVDSLLEGDAIGLVRYNGDAQPLQPILPLGDAGPSDKPRRDTIALLRSDQLAPAGATSIGDGLFEGRKLLDAADLERKALVVLSDGKENRPRLIADVAPDVQAQTFALGFGAPQNTSAVALQQLAGNHGGFLLVTGRLSRQRRLALHDGFLEIQAAISGAEVLAHRDGTLVDDHVQRVPFVVTEVDAGIEVIVVSDQAEAIDFRLQAPSGRILEPWQAGTLPALRFVHGKHCSYYRLVLPIELLPGRPDREGTWHALLKRGELQLERSTDTQPGTDHAIVRGLHARARPVRTATVPAVDERVRRLHLAQQPVAAVPPQAAAKRRTASYGLRVHVYSSIQLRAELSQASHEPGAELQLKAALTQAGLPLTEPAELSAEVVAPTGARSSVPLMATGPGQYALQLAAAETGLHAVRVVARGRTRLGQPFVRERDLSGVVWRGADGQQLPESGADQELILSDLERVPDSQRVPKRSAGQEG